MLEALGLPADAAVGFATGATMSNFTGLAAARHAVLARAGWDVEADGLIGAPPVRVLVGEQVHASLLVALRYAGFGAARAERIAADDQGAMRADALARALAAGDGPAIVCAQAGEVNTGACDPLDADRDGGARARRVAARRRRLRPVGGREPAAAPPGARAPSSPTRGRSTRTSG